MMKFSRVSGPVWLLLYWDCKFWRPPVIIFFQSTNPVGYFDACFYWLDLRPMKHGGAVGLCLQLVRPMRGCVEAAEHVQTFAQMFSSATSPF